MFLSRICFPSRILVDSHLHTLRLCQATGQSFSNFVHLVDMEMEICEQRNTISNLLDLVLWLTQTQFRKSAPLSGNLTTLSERKGMKGNIWRDKERRLSIDIHVQFRQCTGNGKSIQPNHATESFFGRTFAIWPKDNYIIFN